MRFHQISYDLLTSDEIKSVHSDHFKKQHRCSFSASIINHFSSPQRFKSNTNDPVSYELVSRDPVRTPFPWDDSKNAGFSTAEKTWLPVGNNYKTVNVKAQLEAENSHLKIFQKLTKIRKQPFFKRGDYSGALTNNKSVYVFKRQLGDQYAIIILNFGTTEGTVNARAAFPSISESLVIYTSSLDSELKNG